MHFFQFKKADGTDLEDTVVGVKHSDLDWLIDNSGVFYSVLAFLIQFKILIGIKNFDYIVISKQNVVGTV